MASSDVEMLDNDPGHESDAPTEPEEETGPVPSQHRPVQASVLVTPQWPPVHQPIPATPANSMGSFQQMYSPQMQGQVFWQNQFPFHPYSHYYSPMNHFPQPQYIPAQAHYIVGTGPVGLDHPSTPTPAWQPPRDATSNVEQEFSDSLFIDIFPKSNIRASYSDPKPLAWQIEMDNHDRLLVMFRCMHLLGFETIVTPILTKVLISTIWAFTITTTRCFVLFRTGPSLIWWETNLQWDLRY
ncbi:hypothetical protein C8J56DRAFT_1044842 [Mycena floridula]|nr:hypothetical protein C8J56DRAFT_1044842 [Mycena floridula]